MKLSISIEMPKMEEPRKDKPSLEEKVRDCLECIESNEDSRKEWEFIRTLNNKLMKKKRKGSRATNLLEMIAPVIEKYGPKDPNGVLDDAKYSSVRESGNSKSLKKSTKYLGDLG